MLCTPCHLSYNGVWDMHYSLWLNCIPNSQHLANIIPSFGACIVHIATSVAMFKYCRLLLIIQLHDHPPTIPGHFFVWRESFLIMIYRSFIIYSILCCCLEASKSHVTLVSYAFSLSVIWFTVCKENFYK